jgi:hypothetical protein
MARLIQLLPLPPSQPKIAQQDLPIKTQHTADANCASVYIDERCEFRVR